MMATDRTIDITTIGRQTGLPRRIEIWYHVVGNRYYLTGTPGKPRSWYANLRANPQFTFHLKESLQCDLPARARPISAEGERRQILAAVLKTLDQSADLPLRPHVKT